MRSSFFLFTACVALAACQPKIDTAEIEAIDNEAVAAGTTCGADKLQYLVGTPVSDLDRSVLSASHRVIGPNDLITYDFRPQRVNVTYGKNGNIVAVRCG